MKKYLIILSLVLLAAIGYSQNTVVTKRVVTNTIEGKDSASVVSKDDFYLQDTLWFPDGSFQVTSSAFGPGLTWLEPVISFIPVTVCDGTKPQYRYIASATGGGWTDQNIYECDGVGIWAEYVPSLGDAVTVIDSGAVYIFNGVTWETSATTSAFWAANGTKIFNTNAGDVGINTVNPQYPLEVNGLIMTQNGVVFNPVSAPAYEEGKLFYDDDNKTLTLYNEESDVSMQIGQEMYNRVRNTSGVDPIYNGQPVYISGTTGSWPEISLADGNDPEKTDVIGIATMDIADNAFGYVTMAGLVRGINTTGAAPIADPAETWNDGDELFLSPDLGKITNVRPVTGTLVYLGEVVYANATDGIINVHVIHNGCLDTTRVTSIDGQDTLQNFVSQDTAYIDSDVTIKIGRDESTVVIGDTTQFNGRTRQTLSLDVLTAANDTINSTVINVTPTSDYTGAARNLNPYFVDITTNENGSFRMKGIFNTFGSRMTNYNDSIASNFYNTTFLNYNRKGFVQSQGNLTNQQIAPDGVRAKTAVIRGWNSIVNVNPVNTVGGIAEADDLYNIQTGCKIGNYYTTTVGTAKLIYLENSIDARAGATTTLTDWYGIDIDLNTTTPTTTDVGTRTATNMYGINLANTSGITGSSNHYGIYENFGDNYFTNSITSNSYIKGDSIVSLSGVYGDTARFLSYVGHSDFTIGSSISSATDAYMDTIRPKDTLTVKGPLRADKFFGDGSQLTGIPQVWTRTGGTLAPTTAGDTVDVGSSRLLQLDDLDFLSGGQSGVHYSTVLGYTNAHANMAALSSNGNTVMGYQAMNTNNTAGSRDNVVIGYQAAELVNNVDFDDNVVIGHNAGYNQMDQENVIIGGEAGFNIGGTWDNTYIGFKSGYSSTSAYNTCVGHETMSASAGAAYNTVMGWDAAKTIDASYNVAVGALTLTAATTAESNTSVGYASGYVLTEGDNNTFLGWESGFDITTGSGNVLLGYSAGKDQGNFSDQLWIANSNTANPLIYGDFSATGGLTINLQDNSGANYFTVNDISDGNLFTVDDEGVVNHVFSDRFMLYNAMWASRGGKTSSGAGSKSVIIGSTGAHTSIVNGTQDYNTAVGEWAMNNAAGVNVDNNTCIGFRAGDNISTVANTVMGAEALVGAAGERNTAIGAGACNNLGASGQKNTVVGGYSMYLSASSSSYNAVVGYTSMYAASSANYNSTLGYEAGYTLDGDNNVVLGAQAGYSKTSGDGNVLLGYKSGYNLTTESNLLYIENSDASDPLIYGEFDNDYLNVNGDLEIGESMIYTPAVDSAYLAAETLISDTTLIRISGSGGAVTITSTPSITAGTRDGQRLSIMGLDDTNTVTLRDDDNAAGTKLELDGSIDFTMGKYDKLELEWYAADAVWVEVSRSDN